jgi:hypothetical protein
MTELTPREKRERYRQLLAAREEEANAVKRANERVLRDAEWYLLADRREELGIYFWRQLYEGPGYEANRQYDADPVASEKLRKARADYTRSNSTHAWLPCPPELVPRRTAVRMNVPDYPIHYEPVSNFGAEPGGNNWPYHQIWIVSDGWKKAIEELEPAVHEFFPHEIQFDDGVLTNFWVFREGPAIDVIDHARSQLDEPQGEYPGWPINEGSSVFAMNDDDSRKLLCVRRVAVEGRHWIRYGPFVSRALAIKLNPLLPCRWPQTPSTNATRFCPVSVSE